MRVRHVSPGKPRRRSPQGTIFTMLSTVMVTVLALASSVEGAGLPGDARLEPVRAHLQQLIDRADGAGLPSEVIVSKVREGLAKGVDPARIESAVVRLSESLEAAQQYVAARQPGRPPASLVRAVAEARMAGVPLNAVDRLVRLQKPQLQRAVEVVTDLSLRGYPSERAEVVVENVLTHDARSLDRVPGTLETIRQDYALSHTEAVDALARGLASADSLQTAYNRTVEDERKRGHGQSAGKGSEQEGDSPGKSGLAPGQLKKKNRPMVPPGHGH
jgi:hypothetical protein